MFLNCYVKYCNGNSYKKAVINLNAIDAIVASGDSPGWNNVYLHGSSHFQVDMETREKIEKFLNTKTMETE